MLLGGQKLANWVVMSDVSHHFVIALERHIRSGNGITKKRQGAFLI
jgi:hypothetical protein